jgi:hypothetical protein
MRTPAPVRIAAVVVAILLFAPVARAGMADVAKVMTELGFPADAIAKVKAGEMVETTITSSNERELAFGLAFLVKERPREFASGVLSGLVLKTDPDVVAHGSLSGEGTLDQLAGLKLGELTEKYQSATADGDLNLSPAEIQALQALKGKPAADVEAEVKKQLLARYQAYRRQGLDGIAPYARGAKERSGAADLRSGTEANGAAKSVAPVYYDTVLHYPKKPASGFEEVYHWQLYTAHGEPTVILTHGFAVEEGDTFNGLQRQFYVSGGYNAEQAMAGFLPVEGGTLVVYVNRTSTDQVAGFGGRAKRSMGSKLMASQLKSLWADVAKAAEKK